jgi:hypothetical protein
VFESTHTFGFFEYFRVPYDVALAADDEQYGRLSSTRSKKRVLRWPTAKAFPSQTVAQFYKLDGAPIFARVVPDSVLSRRLPEWGTEWKAIAELHDDSGHRIASVWQDKRGSVVLPFDPDEVIEQFRCEGYQNGPSGSGWMQRLRPLLLRTYYLLRPAIPRPLQIALRRVFTRVQNRTTFPAWPIETALHDFYEWMFGIVTDLAGRPVPWLDLWPEGRSWALVLTHDVETDVGLRHRHLLRDLERERSMVSSWNFVPLRYDVEDSDVKALQEEGCEVGVHGLKHDGRDLESLRMLRRRLPVMHRYAKNWGAVGFRSPATHRRWEWMPLLGFSYDSSYHDTAPHEPKPGGSCSYLPFFIDDLVELPITLPQDHTIFTILQHENAGVWIEKASHIRSRRGMALALTHPDYAVADDRVVEGYRLLLDTYADDPSAWHALPKDVADWWRRRAASTVKLGDKGTGWSIVGPALADGNVRFAVAGKPTLTA